MRDTGVLIFRTSTREAEAGDLCEFKDSLVYTASSNQPGLHSETPPAIER